MNKLISFILCVLLVIGIFAGCDLGGGDAADGQTGVFSVGYGSVDISPYDLSVPMSGYGDTLTRYSTEVVNPIYATCVAFRDANGNTLLQFHNDLIGCQEVISFARKDISEATGIPIGNIMVSATHTHHSVATGETDIDSIVTYNKRLREWLVEAAQAALEDLKPAEMYISSIETENMNFIRHYLMKDGTVAGDNFGDKSSGYVDHVSEPDRVLQLIKFTREGGKDVILANFQTHPHRNGGNSVYTGINSDIVGIMRDEVESLLNCEFAYFTGASGNVNPSSKLKEENVTADYQEQGAALAEYAVEAAADFKQVQTGNVQILHTAYKAEPKEAGKAVSDINIYAYSLSDVAFAVAPYEMFSANGEQLKEGSPFAMTFVTTLSNYHVKYIPSYEGFEYDGKLSYGGNVCRYARGTGELLVDEYVRMLGELYETK